MRQPVTKDIFYQVLDGVDTPEFYSVESYSMRSRQTMEFWMKSYKPFWVGPIFRYTENEPTNHVMITSVEQKPTEHKADMLSRFADRVKIYARWYKEYLDKRAVNQEIQVIREPQEPKPVIKGYDG